MYPEHRECIAGSGVSRIDKCVVDDVVRCVSGCDISPCIERIRSTDSVVQECGILQCQRMFSVRGDRRGECIVNHSQITECGCGRCTGMVVTMGKDPECISGDHRIFQHIFSTVSSGEHCPGNSIAFSFRADRHIGENDIGSVSTAEHVAELGDVVHDGSGFGVVVDLHTVHFDRSEVAGDCHNGTITGIQVVLDNGIGYRDPGKNASGRQHQNTTAIHRSRRNGYTLKIHIVRIKISVFHMNDTAACSVCFNVF